MVRPRRVSAKELYATEWDRRGHKWDSRGLGHPDRPRTPEKHAFLRHDYNRAMLIHLRDNTAHETRAQELFALKGLQLGTEILAEEGLLVVHTDYAVANCIPGIVTKVETSVMGEFCAVTWENGQKGCYLNLELRTVGHKRRHGPLEEVPAPPTRPGPAPYCGVDGHGVVRKGGDPRPRGLLPREPPPPLGQVLFHVDEK